MGKPRPLHVLFVARWYPSHDQPGRGSFVADLVSALRVAGVEVTVASFEAAHIRGPVASRAERGAAAAALLAGPVGRTAAVHLPRSWGAPETPVARLPVLLDAERRGPTDLVEAHQRALLPFGRALAERWPIDVIHAHTGLPDGVVAARLADELGLGLLVTEHSSTAEAELDDAHARALYSGLLSGRRRVVAVGRGLANHIALALRTDPANIDVLPNAVPVEAFPTRGPEGRDPNELLYVGSRKASKGIETLLRAFAIARGACPGLTLRLIGSPGQPADEARWRAIVGELDLGASVMVEPAVPRDGVAAAMQRAGLFVHPSPRETFGMVAAEALASGLPVVATPSGGVDDIVGSDGRFGIVAVDADPGGLAAAIEQGLALAPRVDRAAMRAYVVGRFAAGSVADRTVGLYRELIGDDSAAEPRPGTDPTGAIDDATFRWPLVVALARGQAIDRVGQLPPELAGRLSILTSPRGKYDDDRALPAWGRWIEYDPERIGREAVEASERTAPVGGLGRLAGALMGRRPPGAGAAEDSARRDSRGCPGSLPAGRGGERRQRAGESSVAHRSRRGRRDPRGPDRRAGDAPRAGRSSMAGRCVGRGRPPGLTPALSLGRGSPAPARARRSTPR